MTREQLQACTKKELETLARKKGISGWHEMRKDQLIRALARLNGRATNGRMHAKSPNGRLKLKTARPRPQASAARDTSSSTAEEQVERAKFDTGVPTKDLSARVPKD